MSREPLLGDANEIEIEEGDVGDSGVALRDDGNNMEMPSNESKFTPDVRNRLKSLRSDWFSVQKDLGMQMAFNRYDNKRHWSRPKYTLMIFYQKIFNVGVRRYLRELEMLQERLQHNDTERKYWVEQMKRFQERFNRYKLEGPKEELAVFDNLAWLPMHLNNMYVIDVVRRVASVEKENSEIHFLADHVVGPAVQHVFLANILLWSFYGAFPFLACWLLSKNGGWWTYDTTGGSAFASCSKLVWVPYMCLVMILLLIELRALVFVLPCQVAVVGPFVKKFPAGFTGAKQQDWSFYVCLLCLTSLSIIAHMDVASNALFLSKVLAMNSFQGSRDGYTALDDIEHYWRNVWKKSSLNMDPPRFASVLVSVWLLLFSQFIYALLGSVPVSTHVTPHGWRCASLDGLKALLCFDPESDFYKIRDRDLGDGITHGFYAYNTILHRCTEHNASLMTLASAARMYALRFNSWTYKKRLVESGRYKSGQVYNDISSSLCYFLFFLMFENIVQLELQASTLEIGKAMKEPHTLDKEIQFSLALSFTMAVYNLYSTCSKMKDQAIACHKASTDKSVNSSEEFNKRAKKFFLPITVVVFFVLVLLYVILLLHAFGKTIMVSFVCACGWNFKLTKSGCVSFEPNTTDCPTKF